MLEAHNFKLDIDVEKGPRKATGNIQIQKIVTELEVTSGLKQTEVPEFRTSSEAINYYEGVWDSKF